MDIYHLLLRLWQCPVHDLMSTSIRMKTDFCLSSLSFLFQFSSVRRRKIRWQNVYFNRRWTDDDMDSWSISMWLSRHFQEKPIKLSLIGSNGHSRIYINLQYSSVYAQYLPMPNMSFSFIIRTISTWSDLHFLSILLWTNATDLHSANIVKQIWRRLYQVPGSHAPQFPYAWNRTIKEIQIKLSTSGFCHSV